MKFQKQILDFFIKTNDEINQMKESHYDDQLKEYLISFLMNFICEISLLLSLNNSK